MRRLAVRSAIVFASACLAIPLALPMGAFAASPPVAFDGSGQTRVDVPLDIFLDAFDPDDDPLSFAIVSAPAHGDLDDCTSGQCIYTPDAGYQGSDSLTWTASDGVTDSNTATFDIEVVANSAPEAFDQETQTRVDTGLEVVLDAFDSDDDSLTFTILGAPVHGDLDDCSAGSCTYTPDTGYLGPDSFTWKANDGTADSATATFSIDVVVNSAPEAFDQSAQAEVDSPLFVSLDAIDPENDDLTFAIVSSPTHGDLDDCSAGDCTYTPDPGYVGPDSFTWKANDGLVDSNTATFSISVTPGPVAIVTEGPLTRIQTTVDLNCSVDHTGDANPEFFGGTACGTLLVVDGVLYGPASIPAGGAASPLTPWTFVDQSALTGAGTSQDPWKIVSVVAAGTTGVQVTQTDTYVTGSESYRTEIAISDSSGAAHQLRLYRAGDCFLQESDQGFGILDPSTGAVSCRSGEISGGDTVPGPRVIQWFPLSPGSHAYEAGFSQVWSLIGDQLPFPDTCLCDQFLDNGAGLSWDVALAANGTTTRSHLTTFSPLGRVPLTTAKTADQASTDVGGANGYTITIDNPNNGSATLQSITDQLPSGFAYVAGTTTGATTDDPSIAGDVLTWAGPLPVGAQDSVSIHFDVTVADTAGTYFNEAGGDGGTDPVIPTGSTAPITVEEATNAPPDAVDDAFTVAEASETELDVLGNDTDPDDDALTIISASATSGQGGSVDCSSGESCIYAPPAGFTGTDTFTYTIDDGSSGTDTATVTVTVAACPDLTGALGDDGIVTGQQWIACSSPTAHAARGADLTPLFQPTGPTLALMTSGDAALADGPNDSSSAGRDNLTILRGANDVSILRLDLDVPAAADCLAFNVIFASEEYPEYVGSPFDDGFLAELDASTWSVAGSTISAPNNFAFDLAGDVISVNSSFFDPDRVVTDNGMQYDGATALLQAQTPITPGIHSLYLSIFDATDHILDSAALIDDLRAYPSGDAGCAQGADQAPLAVDDTANTAEGTPVSIDVLDNDSDADGDTISLIAVSDPADGSATIALDGTVEYTPDTGFSGLDAFTYTISDGRGGTASATVTVTVGAVSDTPPDVDAGSDASAAEGASVALSGSVIDPDDVPTIAWSASPGSDVDGGASCTFDEPTAAVTNVACSDDGTWTLTLTADDGTNPPVADSLVLSLTNADPVVDAGADQSVADGALVALDPATFSDAGTTDSHTATIDWGDGTSESGSVGGTAAAGTVSGSHTYGGPDTYTVTVTVTDDDTGAGSDTLEVTVEEPAPASADLGLTLTDTPDPVSSARDIKYTLTVTNGGPDDATGVTVEDTLPAGTTFVSADTADGSCGVEGGVVSCDLGDVSTEDVVTIDIVVTAPNATIGTTVTNEATVAANQDDPNPGDNTASESTTVRVPAADPDVASGWITTAGGSVQTGGGSGPSKKDPMTTTVIVPPGFEGVVTIEETAITSCPAGFSCFGQQANIVAPTTTAASPLHIVFLYHQSAVKPGGTKPDDIVMFHDDVLVPRCSTTSGVADPDPCILSAKKVMGNVRVEVLSSHNGSWKGGR